MKSPGRSNALEIRSVFLELKLVSALFCPSLLMSSQVFHTSVGTGSPSSTALHLVLTGTLGVESKPGVRDVEPH